MIRSPIRFSISFSHFLGFGQVAKVTKGYPSYLLAAKVRSELCDKTFIDGAPNWSCSIQQLGSVDPLIGDKLNAIGFNAVRLS
jgi:hypothetical protein